MIWNITLSRKNIKLFLNESPEQKRHFSLIWSFLYFSLTEQLIHQRIGTGRSYSWGFGDLEDVPIALDIALLWSIKSLIFHIGVGYIQVRSTELWPSQHIFNYDLGECSGHIVCLSHWTFTICKRLSEWDRPLVGPSRVFKAIVHTGKIMEKKNNRNKTPECLDKHCMLWCGGTLPRGRSSMGKMPSRAQICLWWISWSSWEQPSSTLQYPQAESCLA